MTDTTLPNVPVEGDDVPQAEYISTEDVDATHAAEATDEDESPLADDVSPGHDAF